MTSQVALFNKQGVAIASDTALTVQSGDIYKTTSNCEKIRALGGDHLVAVAHSGSGELNDIDVGTLLSAWIDSLQGPFDRLQDYPESFRHWPKFDACKVFPENQVKWYLKLVLEELLYHKLIGYGEKIQIDSDGQIAADKALLQSAEEWREDFSHLPLFDELEEPDTSEIILSNFGVSFDDYLAERIGNKEGFTEILPLAKELISLAIARRQAELPCATLAFVGFGRSEYFPTSIKLDLYGFGSGFVATIQSSSHPSRPAGAYQILAQGEAILGFLSGYQPEIFSFVDDFISSKANDYFPGPEPEVAADRLVSDLLKQVSQFSQNNFSEPILQTIASMPMLTLVDFAASLVEMQATFAAATQDGGATVGGFIESLFISRDHGVKWTRRLPRL